MIVEFRYFYIDNHDSERPDFRYTEDKSTTGFERAIITKDDKKFIKSMMDTREVRLEIYKNHKKCFEQVLDLFDENDVIAWCNEKEFNCDPIAEIEKFQKDRLLDKQSYNFKNEILNILEELVEMTGEESDAARKTAEGIFENYFKDKLIVNRDQLADCHGDIVVFSIGSLMKLGYKPKCVLHEIAKEINSRVGKIIDGKFVKDKSPEAKAKWYKADFNNCKVKK